MSNFITNWCVTESFRLWKTNSSNIFFIRNHVKMILLNRLQIKSLQESNSFIVYIIWSLNICSKYHFLCTLRNIAHNVHNLNRAKLWRTKIKERLNASIVAVRTKLFLGNLKVSSFLDRSDGKGSLKVAHFVVAIVVLLLTGYTS